MNGDFGRIKLLAVAFAALTNFCKCTKRLADLVLERVLLHGDSVHYRIYVIYYATASTTILTILRHLQLK